MLRGARPRRHGLAADRRVRQQRTPDDYFADFAKRGATFCRFNPSYGRRYLLRNHQKLALADAEGRTRDPDRRIQYRGRLFRRRSTEGAGATSACWSKGRRRRGWRLIIDELMAWALSQELADASAAPRWSVEFSETSGTLQWQFGGPTRASRRGALRPAAIWSHSRDVEMIAAYFAPTWAECCGGSPASAAAAGRG